MITRAGHRVTLHTIFIREHLLFAFVFVAIEKQTQNGNWRSTHGNIYRQPVTIIAARWRWHRTSSISSAICFWNCFCFAFRFYVVLSKYRLPFRCIAVPAQLFAVAIVVALVRFVNSVVKPCRASIRARCDRISFYDCWCAPSQTRVIMKLMTTKSRKSEKSANKKCERETKTQKSNGGVYSATCSAFSLRFGFEVLWTKQMSAMRHKFVIINSA